MSRPLGIMASFSKVSFKKDGAEVFSASVTSGGCFGPDKALDVVNRGYAELNHAVSEGKVDKAALDFNAVSVSPQFGTGGKEYSVTGKTATRVSGIKQVR